MNFVTRFAVKTLLKESHPLIVRKQCWNLRPHKEKCSACVDVCPYSEQIFKRPGIIANWSACTDCGLCVAACKSRCIAPSREQVEKDSTLVEVASDQVWLGCTQSERYNTAVRECIAAFPWEFLAFLALNKKVVLDLTPCATCENEACAERLRLTLERLVEFLGAELFSARVALAREMDEYPNTTQSFSRRDLAGVFKEGSVANSRKLLRKMPFLIDESEGHLYDFRMMLYDHVKQLKEISETPRTYGKYLPKINEKCYGCERCVRACKAEALKIVEGKDGLSRVVITAWKCSECGQCVRSCIDKAIEGPILRPVTQLGPIGVYKFKKNACPKCGKAKKPTAKGELCVNCDLKERSRKRQEEAAERMRIRKAEREAANAAKQAEEAAKAETQPENSANETQTTEN